MKDTLFLLPAIRDFSFKGFAPSYFGTQDNGQPTLGYPQVD